MDMLRQAFSLATLQNCRALLMQAAEQGLTVAELIVAIDTRLNATQPTSAERTPGRIVSADSPRTGRCPHCGAPLAPVANPDGLRIIGCKRCRYSYIVESK